VEAPVIVGVGLDVVGVERAARLLARHGQRLLDRCFVPEEIARPRDPEHLAGLLAAKEAAFKALGCGWGARVGWRDATVARDASGAPRLELGGEAAALAGSRGARTWHLSITHAAGVAIAVVILED